MIFLKILKKFRKSLKNSEKTCKFTFSFFETSYDMVYKTCLIKFGPVDFEMSRWTEPEFRFLETASLRGSLKRNKIGSLA